MTTTKEQLVHATKRWQESFGQQDNTIAASRAPSLPQSIRSPPLSLSLALFVSVSISHSLASLSRSCCGFGEALMQGETPQVLLAPQVIGTPLHYDQ